MVEDNKEHSEHIVEEQHESLLYRGTWCHYKVEFFCGVEEGIFLDERLDTVPLARRSHFFDK